MKRFYKAASHAPVDRGHAVYLDGRAVKTPAKLPLIVPSEALASAISGEWAGQKETIDPETMPLTRLANGAIDRVVDARDAVIDEILRYGETDLLCYRADGPDSLIIAQARAWDPLLDWAKTVLHVDLPVQTGIMPQKVRPETLMRLRQIVEELDGFILAGLGALVASSGSIIIGLAVLKRHITGKEAANIALIDDVYQLERWGEDDEALAKLKARRADIKSAANMLNLL